MIIIIIIPIEMAISTGFYISHQQNINKKFKLSIEIPYVVHRKSI